MSLILVTGGCGFIGSHTCVELLAAGHEVQVIDNLVNSSPEALKRVERITGRSITFHQMDMLDLPALAQLFQTRAPDAVIHFAALKAVGESVSQPLRYYRNNLDATLNLLSCMQQSSCRQLVFSSSATVYGDPSRTPVTEDMPLSATNPYGRSKLMIEDMCRDMVRSDATWRIALLRYFNPIGAHASGSIGEDPLGTPNNLMPYLLQVASGAREFLTVHGNDYPTADGTGVRDYIHVVDLALGHVAALHALPGLSGAVAINLGTGRGHSVLELIAALSKEVGRALPYRIGPRRPGDIANCFADVALAKQLLGWESRRGIEDMCADGWRWQLKNPQGYRH